MSIRTDQVNLIVNVNGDKARKELNDLRKNSADVSEELKGLKRGTQEWIDKSNELKTINTRMNELKNSMGLAGMTLKELQNELKKLNAMKGSLTPQTKEFDDLQKKINAVTDRLYEVKNGVYGFGATLNKIKDEIKAFGAVALAALGLDFLAQQFTSIVQGAGKLSDQLADIRKSTGLTDDEVKKLNKSFGELATRTSTSDLRDIAKVGGQLGIAKDQILGFTESVDKLNVALGDEFAGGAEEITNVVGKLRNTFTDIKSDNVGDDLLKIGNALNLLGQEGIATAPIVSNLAQRIGSAGQIYGMTAGQTFGLSAAMQELGITAERGGTAVVKVLQKLSKSPEDFAKIAKMGTAEFTNLVNTNITGALQKVAEGFASSKGKATEFAEKLADAEIGSAAITEVFAKLGTNTSMVTEKINLASGALQGNSSIMAEFNLKNETFGATLDKLGKEFNKLVTSPGVTNFLKGAIDGLLTFIKGISALPNWISQNIKALTAFGATLLLLRLDAFAVFLQQIIYSLGMYIVSGKAATFWTGALASAQKLLTLALQATIAASIFLAFKINELEKEHNNYLKSLSATATKLRNDNEARKQAVEIMKDQVVNTQLLVMKINSENTSYAEKEKLLKQLKESSGGYLNALTLENIKTQEGTTLLNNYVKALYAKAEAQAKEELLVDKMKKLEQLKAKYGIDNLNDVNKIYDKQTAAENAAGSDSFFGFLGSLATGNKTKMQEVNADFDELRVTMKDVDYLGKSITKSAIAASGGKTPGSASYSDGQSKDEVKAAEKKAKELQRIKDRAAQEEDNYKKLLEELAKLREEARLAQMTEEDKEIERVHEKYKKLITLAANHAKELMELKGLESSEIDKIVQKWDLKNAEDTGKSLDEKGVAIKAAFKEWGEIIKTETEALLNQPTGNATAEGISAGSAKYKKDKEDKEAKKVATRKEIEDAVKEGLQISLGIASDIANMVATNQQNQLKRELKNNDIRKTAQERLLKNHLISQKQYDREIAKIDADNDKRKHDFAVKEANRQKAFAIVQAVINTAEAISKALTAGPIIGPIMATLMGIAGGVQIAAIANTEVPVGRKGLFLDNGPSHEEGGISMYDNRTGRQMAEIEGGESVMVLSKQATANNRGVISALMSSSQGNGHSINYSWANKHAALTPHMVPMMAKGGLIPMNDSTQMTQEFRDAVRMMSAALVNNNSSSTSQPSTIRAVVSLRDIRNANDTYESLRRTSSINQNN